MALLLLDLETSGLPRRDLPLGDVGQPWMVRVAAEHATMDGRPINRIDITIKPEGRKVKPGAQAVHGIDAAFAERFGLQENAILSILADMAGKSLYVLSFGDLDRWVIESLMVRLEEKLNRPGAFQKRWVRPGLQFIDIQKPACQMACKLPSDRDDGDYRWPSLDEASTAILGEAPREGLHDAWDDLGRCRRLFVALRERGHFAGAIAS